MEGEVNPCAHFPKGKQFGEWIIREQLDEGGFGTVYRVESSKEAGRMAALKTETNENEGGSAIKLEMHVLKTIHRDGEKMHVPTVFHAAKHSKFCYMVMMLLGENLKSLMKDRRPGEPGMSLGTWSRVAVQCLYSIKLVHDYGFVHRDIKPNNFVMGHPTDPERARIVHILDFGMTRAFTTKRADGLWVAKRARASAEFRGTYRYCSPNVHLKVEQGRRDDLWGLLYVVMEMHGVLPWQMDIGRTCIRSKKMNTSDDDLMKPMPEECRHLPAGLRALDCYNRPNYSEWANAFKAVYTRLNVQYWDKFDWEKADEVESLRKKVDSRLPLWMTDGDASQI